MDSARMDSRIIPSIHQGLAVFMARAAASKTLGAGGVEELSGRRLPEAGGFMEWGIFSMAAAVLAGAGEAVDIMVVEVSVVVEVLAVVAVMEGDDRLRGSRGVLASGCTGHLFEVPTPPGVEKFEVPGRGKRGLFDH